MFVKDDTSAVMVYSSHEDDMDMGMGDTNTTMSSDMNSTMNADVNSTMNSTTTECEFVWLVGNKKTIVRLFDRKILFCFFLPVERTKDAAALLFRCEKSNSVLC